MSLDPLQTSLQQLERADLIRRMNDPDGAYVIRHALVQETVRGSMLNQERKRLNRQVGDALEQLYADRLDEIAVRLAQHYDAAGNDSKSCMYWQRAGENALRLSALHEAFQHFSYALAAAQRAGLETREAFLKCGRVLELRGEYAAAVDKYRAMFAWGEQRQDPGLQLAALMAQATIHAIPSAVHNVAAARALSEQALQLAQRLGDKAAEAKILWNMMLLNSRIEAHHRQALAYGEAALQLAEEQHLEELRAYILNDLSPLYAFLGPGERSEAVNLEARAQWRAWGNLPMLADNLSYAVMNYLVRGRFVKAVQESEEAYRISVEIGNAWNQAFSRTWIGEAYVELGEIATALQVMESVVQEGDAFPPARVLTRADLTHLLADLGDYERAVRLGEQAVAVAEAQFPTTRVWAAGALAHAYLAQGKVDRARALLSEGPLRLKELENPRFRIDYVLEQVNLALVTGDISLALEVGGELLAELERAGHLQYVLPARRLYGEALARSGNFSDAAAMLAAARALAEDLQARWSLWQILAASSRVETLRGDGAAAREFAAAAQRWIEWIAARTPEDRAHTWLNTPPVQNVIEAAG